MVPTRTSRKSGFTLIELLVVIAIIAILAAILFPVFARARENARRASCQSNLKQVGLGLFMYTQDYDERLLPGEYPYGASAPEIWTDLLAPYLKSTQLLRCPSRSSNVVAYGWNYNYFGFYDPATDGKTGWATALASLNCPTETLLSGDGGLDSEAFGLILPAYPDRVAKLHLDGGNFLFADGHVKYHPHARIIQKSGWYTQECTDN